MQTLKIKLENCYGIKKLKTDLDFSQARAIAIYAPNGSKKDLEAEISSTFTKTDKEFFEALVRVKDEVIALRTAHFANIKYDEIFDTKILEFLKTKDVCTAIKDYIEKYDKLIAASTYF